MKAEECKIGLPVVYYLVITSKGEKLLPHFSEIDSDPWRKENSNMEVVKLRGLTREVPLNHLVPVHALTDYQRIEDAYRGVKFQLRNVKGCINSKGFFAAEVKTDCLIKAAKHLLEVLNEINNESQN